MPRHVYPYVLIPTRLPRIPWRRKHSTYYNALAEAHRILKQPFYRPQYVLVHGPDLPRDGHPIRTLHDR